VIAFILKRILRKPGLALLTILSIALPVGVLNSVPLFSGAVDRAVLREELTIHGASTHRPPFGIRMYAYGTPKVPLSLATVTSALDTIAATLQSQIGLRVTHTGMEVHSVNFLAETPEAVARVAGGGKPAFVTFATQPGVLSRLETVAGAPYDDATSSDGVVDVWLRHELAAQLNVAAGDEFPCVADQRLWDHDDLATEGLVLEPLTVRVAGTWRPAATVPPENLPWFDDPTLALANSLLVSTADYQAHIQPRQRVKIHRVNWDLILDIEATEPDRATRYLRGLQRSISLMQQSIPSALYDQAPYEPLQGYVARDRVLTAQLLSYSIPGLGFLLFFLALTASIVARGHAQDTMALLSRGMTTPRLISVTALEGALLAIVAVPLGIALAVGLSHVMGSARGLLVFRPGADYPIELRDLSPVLSLVAVVTVVSFRMVATVGHARGPIAGMDLQRARPAAAPAWMRFGTDVWLLIPTLYLTRQLTRTGSLAMLAPLRGEDLFGSVELVLVPALFLATTSLLSIRLFPLLATSLGTLAKMSRTPTWLLAMRHLARQWQAYATPVLLMTASLSLGAYTLSLATSLDGWLADQIRYSIGADLAFTPYLEIPPPEFGWEGTRPIGGGWIPPIDEFRALPGATAATRIGRYKLRIGASAATSTGPLDGRLLAVDRADLAQVVWFRPDFSEVSLGHLMNVLAVAPEAVLVPESLLSESYLQIGDKLQVTITVDPAVVVRSDVTIAGTYRDFPTVYPQDGVTLIGNLDHIASVAGIVPVHDIMVEIDGSVDGDTTLDAVEATGVEAQARKDVAELTATARARHEYVGIVGTLSIGCLASAGLAVLALLVYRQAALRDRVWWMTVLHAVGLPRGHLLGALLIEQTVLLVYGAGIALGLGTWASRIYVPLMRITETSQSLLPAMVPRVALWEAGVLIAVVLAASGIAELVLVMRTFRRSRFNALRVFQ